MSPSEPCVAPQAISITVLTGFLGAGKTTLLNRILTADHGLRVAVLVNDFGSINIDADLVVGVESDVVSLANGCICCSIRDDLIEAVTRVLERPERPEYVLLEASGAAEPSGIAVTFTDARFRDRIRLDSVTCVMDAEQVFAGPERMHLKLWQVGFADMPILNKMDLVGCHESEKITAWLDEHFHRYRLIEATRCDVPLGILLSVGRFEAAQFELPPHDHYGHASRDLQCQRQHNDHSHAFGTWSYKTERPLSLAALREVASRLPVNIYRCKGVVHSVEAGTGARCCKWSASGWTSRSKDAWGDRSPRTRIVAIGAHRTLDDASLRERVDHCRT